MIENFNDILPYVRVVESGNMTAAAKALNLTPSAVSKSIGRLESRLGVQLLNRTTRRITPTAEGTLYFERCQRILADLQDAENALSATRSAPRGLLRVSAPNVFTTTHLARAATEFLKQYPEVRMDLHLTDQYVDILGEGYDVGIRIADMLPDSSLIARKLAVNRRVVVGSPDYFARAGTPSTPDDLLEHNCLLVRRPDVPYFWRFEGPEGPREIPVSGNLVSDNGLAVYQAALAGAGLALLPTYFVGHALSDGRLRAVLSKGVAADSNIHVIYPPSRHLLPRVRAFLDFLSERFDPDMPDWDRALQKSLQQNEQSPA